MSAEEMNKEIALAIGYKLMEGRRDVYIGPDGASYYMGHELPEYSRSRDAAISAVVELCDTGPKQIKYGVALDEVLRSAGAEYPAWFEMSVATPEKICTALVKALGIDQKGTQA